jgi:serine/threonine-protein kinase
MFLDEARLAARVRHPNVASVIDVVEGQGEVVLVMEYIHGASLARLVHSADAVHPPIACAILCGVLTGLHAAHEAKNEHDEPLGIVHRDVSPQNIMVGVDGLPRVLDFGVAKARGRTQTTREGEIKGKLAYMPPEQLQGGVVNRQADVYSASVVLWELLTGRRLFDGPDEGSVIQRILFAPIDPPSRLVPGLPRGLDAIVMRGLSRERSSRFSTAREMALALQQGVNVASSAEVGDWVALHGEEDIERRAGLVAQIERADDCASAESNASPAVPAPQRKRRIGKRLVAVALAAGAIAGAAVLVNHTKKATATVTHSESNSDHAAPPSRAAAAVERPPTEPQAPTPDPTPDPSPNPNPTPALNPTPTPPPHLVGTLPVTRVPRRDCDPPFSRDEAGRKIYKRQCL